jgi:hypothetical protein
MQMLSVMNSQRCIDASIILIHTIILGHNIRGNLIPTSVNTVMTDSKTCIVGYTSASVAQFDFHGEKIIQVLRSSDIDNSESRDAQINQVISHPTMPIVIAAHQDRKLRFYDLRTGDSMCRKMSIHPVECRCVL